MSLFKWFEERLGLVEFAAYFTVGSYLLCLAARIPSPLALFSAAAAAAVVLNDKPSKWMVVLPYVAYAVLFVYVAAASLGVVLRFSWLHAVSLLFMFRALMALLRGGRV